MALHALTLFGSGAPEIRLDWQPRRTVLDPCCWVDYCPLFIHGGDSLLAELQESLEWGRGRRLMYGTWHEEPRLTASHAASGRSLPSVLHEIRSSLSHHYDRSFTGLFCNSYETGADSVAWHADRIGRSEVDPLVAIISLGGPRRFLLRPLGGGSSTRLELGSGDLLIMGGATQHHWEHSVPKVLHAHPRVSVTMRAGGPRRSLSVPGAVPLRASQH